MSGISAVEGPLTGQGLDDSVIAERYLTGQWQHTKGEHVPERYPTDKEVAEAVFQQVSASVETYRRYRHVAWYTLFVGLYMLVLYFQASSVKSGEVIATLQKAFIPEGQSTTLTFSSEDQVLEYIANRIVRPIWKDPVCGDGKCEMPWEFPAWGPFGCQADCGLNPNTSKIIVVLSGDFTGHPSISANTLMAQVKWNLCLNDTSRIRRGLPVLCWFKEDQVFTQSLETQIRAVNLIDGDWYIRLEGDLAGRVTGAVYNGTTNDLVEMPISPPWEACEFRRRRTPVNNLSMRKLMADLAAADSTADQPEITGKAVASDTAAMSSVRQQQQAADSLRQDL